MVALYVTSLSPGSGKSTICAGIGKLLLEKGRRVGYFRPVISPDGENGDAVFFKGLFKMDEPVDVIAPVFGDEAARRTDIKEANDRFANIEINLVEGVFGESNLSIDLAAALGASVIIVADYADELQRIIEWSCGFGTRLLGVIINKVPGSRMRKARNEVQPRLEAVGIKVLGVLPEDRSLLALTVGELAEKVHGEMLRGSEKTSGLVENVMLGASNVDAGPAYYERKANKAAVVKSERPDMQMAALETSTACLVLAGDTPLKDIVLDHARETDVPIVLVREDVPSVVARIEEAVVNSRFRQERKLPRLAEMMREHLDLAAIGKALGLADLA
ncbi:MAG: phosphotransacetylase family protein [Chloroflexi bacterium]|nr:phosphotransacetylase family protein [Chloroflexota bacterium]